MHRDKQLAKSIGKTSQHTEAIKMDIGLETAATTEKKELLLKIKQIKYYILEYD